MTEPVQGVAAKVGDCCAVHGGPPNPPVRITFMGLGGALPWRLRPDARRCRAVNVGPAREKCQHATTRTYRPFPPRENGLDPPKTPGAASTRPLPGELQVLLRST